jgi:hypothetical protein
MDDGQNSLNLCQYLILLAGRPINTHTPQMQIIPYRLTDSDRQIAGLLTYSSSRKKPETVFFGGKGGILKPVPPIFVTIIFNRQKMGASKLLPPHTDVTKSPAAQKIVPVCDSLCRFVPVCAM